MQLMHTKDLTLGYHGKTIIQDCNLAIHEKDYICIVGSNGSGKTTLLKGLLELIPAKQGKVIRSHNLEKKHIGYLPQITTLQQNFPASVYEIVASGLLNTKKTFPILNHQEKQQVLLAMKKLRIDHLYHTSYKELSGGQQQKVLFARSLCATQKILFLDEPITGLDESSRKEVYQLLNIMHKQEHKTIIMITHNKEEVLPFATKIVTINNQKVYTETIGENRYVA